jgi:hypothetical protein
MPGASLLNTPLPLAMPEEVQPPAPRRPAAYLQLSEAFMSAGASGIDLLPVTQGQRTVLRLPPETDRQGSNAPLQPLARSARAEPPFATAGRPSTPLS